MNSLEFVREKLHSVIESGDPNNILAVSQELDKLILRYMKLQLNLNRNFAS